MQWAAAPRRRARRYINASQNTSESLSTRLPSRRRSVMRPPSDTSIRVGWSLSCCFQSYSRSVSRRAERDGNCSLTLQTFLSRQQVALGGGGGAAAMSIPVHQWPTRCHSSCSARRKLTNCRLLSMSSKSCLQVASFKFLIFNQNSSF